MTALAAPGFSPDLRAADPLGEHWLRQAALRARRELVWRSQLRRSGGDSGRLVDSLDLARHWEAKQRFFAQDAAAAYLSERLAEPFAGAQEGSPRGSFGWVAEELELDRVARFGLALALLGTFDSAAGPVIAACLNDAGRTQPSLELAQRLWDAPEETLALFDPAHPLWRRGLLDPSPGALGWDTPLVVSPLVAASLLLAGERPEAAPPPAAPAAGLDAELVRGRLAAGVARGLRVVPLLGRPGAPFASAAAALAAATGLPLRPLELAPGRLADPAALRGPLTRAWLHGEALLLLDPGREPERLCAALAAAAGITAVAVVAVHERAELAALPAGLLLPAVTLPPLAFRERAALWRRELAHPATEEAVLECARRFRFEPETVRALAAGLNALGRPPERVELEAACRAEVQVECGELAELVTPRFEHGDLVLDGDRTRQLEEVHRAMTALTEVHYEWGTAQAWNEGGISVLFAGPPGTGKTMAAEVLARRLDMPMYRIELSQVVDKYIGVTEKNLKRLFDAADVSDVLLFFDEADALFGRRTEVRDAHDRYANLEVSYLLERMERFKGLAILATNRRKDLDEAFLRRLRFIVEFPLPEEAEREQIWRRVIPPRVDASALDLPFLARRFPLAGGHIRSIVFNACLQSAGEGEPALTMDAVLVAVKREYDKLKRSISLTQFGDYADAVEGVGR